MTEEQAKEIINLLRSLVVYAIVAMTFLIETTIVIMIWFYKWSRFYNVP